MDKSEIEDLAVNIKETMDTIRPQMEAFKEFVSTLQEIDFDGFVQQYRNYIQEFNRLSKELKTNYDEVVKVFNKYKWFVPIDIPITFLWEILELSNMENPQEKIDAHFFNYFAANDFEYLKILVKKWENSGKFKQKRMKIINDCLNVIINAREGEIPNSLIMPTLIAQIDGIQTEYILKDLFEMNGPRITLKSNGTATKREKAWVHVIEEMDAIDNSISSLINDAILNVLFEGVNPGEPIKAPINFSRHKIMHGEYDYLDYGTNSNTLRAFIILDFLHDLPF